MLIRNFEEVEEAASKVGPKRVSVVGAHSREFLLALKEAQKRGYVEPVLIGDEKKIRAIAEEIKFDITKFLIIDSRNDQEIADRGVQLAVSGETDFVLRAYVESAPFYRAIIKSSSQRGIKSQICAVALIKFPALPKIIGLTDPGVNVAPDFKAKIGILKNAVNLFSRLGYECPQVGIFAARRELDGDLDSVSDAVKIREAFATGEFPECRFAEGLSLSDFFLGAEGFLEGFDEIDFSQVPDIWLVHNLELGNILVKIDSIAERDFFSGVGRHGIITGSGIPTMMPSRSDTHEQIITDIAVGVLIS